MPAKDYHNPPKWAERFLEWYCAPEHLEDVQGALYEYFYERVQAGQLKQARRYYILDVMGHFRPHLLKRKKTQTTFYLAMFNSFFKISIRNLWKHKMTSLLNVLGLAVGLTCFLMIMIWVNHEEGFDSFHEKKDRIYRISNTFTSESEQFSQAPSGPALGAQLHKLFPQIADGMRFGETSAQLEVDGQGYFENSIGIVDKSFLDIFDFEVVAGAEASLFTEQNSLVLTESSAIKYFGNNRAVGQMVTLDGTTPMKVTGVMADPPSNSQIQFEMLISMDFAKVYWGQTTMDETWGGGWFNTYLLLEDNVDIEELEANLNEFITTKLTFFTERNMSYEYFLQPLTDIHLSSDLRYDIDNNGSARNVSIFGAVAIIVLLLACINYINLSTANAIKRSKEVGIKKVIGALRVHLIIQYLVESLLVVLIAALFSIGLLYLILPGFSSFLGHELQLQFETQTYVMLGLGVVGLGLVAGIFPALAITAYKPLQVAKGNIARGNKGSLVRKALVIFQFTATVVLIIAIITVNRQMQYMQQQDLGMQSDEVLFVNFRGIQSVRNNHQIMRDRLLANPMIKNVSFQRNSYPVGGLSNSTVQVETGDGKRVSSSLYRMVTDMDFVEAYGMEMAAGRFFSREIATDTVSGVVVNEAAVASFGWGTAEDAIGREMGVAPNARKVIGVVKDFNFEGLHRRVQPLRILPIRNNQYGTMSVRANLSEPVELIRFLESTWVEVNPEVPFDYTFMDEDIQNQYEAEFKFRTIFLTFSSISIFIACLGLFGLATASTNQRIKEIGIRKALGASSLGLVRLISREFLILILIALFLASPIAWYGMEQWLDGFAYRIPFNWLFIVLSGAIAFVVSFATVSYEAIKAAIRNPTQSLRHE